MRLLKLLWQQILANVQVDCCVCLSINFIRRFWSGTSTSPANSIHIIWDTIEIRLSNEQKTNLTVDKLS